MDENHQKYRVFLSAAEPSADAHCAALARRLGDNPDIRLVGVGGPKMAEAGVELLEHTVDRAAMTYKAFAQVLYFRGLLQKIKSYISENHVDLFVLCDSPAFNFHLAKSARNAGAKTLFYVAPQLWAWAPWRIRRLRKYCDRLCCILPFEEEWFGKRGVEAEFVGHPLLEGLSPLPMKKYFLGFEPKGAHIAVIPGSRAAEVQSLWEPMQYIAVALKNRYPAIRFKAVALNEKTRERLVHHQLPQFSCDYAIGSVYDTARASDFALVASGSATVQVAAAGCPMVVMYQSSKLLWSLVGKWLVTTEYLSLVNILARHELVPEFMPYFDEIEPIEERVSQLLEAKDQLVQTSGELVELTRPLAAKQPSQRVAQIITEMLAQK